MKCAEYVVKMNLFPIFIFMLFDFSFSTRTTQVTLGVHDRIVLLKRQLVNQIKSKRPRNENLPEDIEVVDENLEYVDHENEPITPINENDPRKKKDRFKLKQIKTTRDFGQNFKSRNDKAVMSKQNQKPSGNVRNSKPINKKQHVIKKSKITDVFYRRIYPNDISNPARTHCQDMITPFLTGHKTNMTNAKRVAYDDSVVIRLIQLLTEDITDHTKDDIHSILYQISNLQLRLFQWDVAAIKLLLNVINRDKASRHTFRTIKNGLKTIFKTWNLSFASNMEALLKQTRIFRPPCIKITDNEDHLLVILNFTQSYVLFAANLDDFKSIAKKIIPDKLADQLTDIASQNSMKYRQQVNNNKQVELSKQVHVDKETDEYNKENIDEEIEYSDEIANRKVVTKPNSHDETTQKKRFAIKDQEKSIDFEELVDRVRQQLEGSKNKQKMKQETYNYHNKDQNADTEENNYESDQIEEMSKHEDTTKLATQDTQYYDDITETAALENDGMFFKEANLMETNDSYEDYVTPERDNIFESDTETRTTNSESFPAEKKTRYKDQRLKAVTEREKPAKKNKAADNDQALPFVDERYDEEEIKKSEEVKAQTESIIDEPNQKGKPKKLKGTMIPTREYFKMSSPNYFGKLPAVAEKYDFNEPLPEKDREPENLKYFANPPARINKKVKLTSN